MKKYLLFYLVIFSLPLFAGCIKQGEGNSEVGEEFGFIALDGSIHHLSDYRGKVVLLDLWATWCNPCKYQMLELKKIYEHYNRSEVGIISINVDPDEGLSEIKDYLNMAKGYGYDFNWVFGDDQDGSIWKKYQIGGGIPTICIFDKEGNLKFSHEGVCVFKDIPSGWPSDIVRLAPIIDELLR